MSEDKKVAVETKVTEETKVFEEKKNMDPYIAGFIESMAKTNTEKIVKETLEGLSEDTGDSDSYDAESGGKVSEDWPWRPSHTIFGKSTIRQSHLDNMRGRYFRDMSTVRAGRDNKVPAPEENEVVIYRSFFKAGLQFSLSRFVVEVLKTYQIFLHQLTPKAILRMRIFVWAIRSQGIEPSVKCFCSMHELLYETKATGKEQYHNNFGCYGFVARANASHLVPTFRKRWPGTWMEEWFYVKNDLTAREDIKEVIMRPIWSRFGLQKPKVEIDDATEACQKAFGTICFFIGTRDLMQEHIAFRVWPLAEGWEMPKEIINDPSKGDLVRLKYTFRFGDKFDEPNDDWLKCIEVTSDELLGSYSKAEDNTLSAAFESQGKKRLNRVFDAIGFVYPDYRYPLRGQGKKRKVDATAAPAEPVLEATRKKLKVLTHRPCYTEPAVVPEFGAGTSSAAEAKRVAPTVQSIEESIMAPKMSAVGPAEARDDKAEELQVEKVIKTPEILRPPTETVLSKMRKIPAATPRRRTMASVLDAVIETMKVLSPAPKKISEASKAQVGAEAGPTVPENKTAGHNVPEKTKTPAPEAPIEDVDYIIQHAAGKKLSEEEISEAKHYARELMYPKGALVFNGTNEDDFLYCLPDNKELSVCREMARSMGFPKLEAGLCAMMKVDLADSLAYNSLKVQKL
jgi:hypothetical protein